MDALCDRLKGRPGDPAVSANGQASPVCKHGLDMARRKRGKLAAEAHRLNLEQLARLGGDVRRSRRRRRQTQATLATGVGVVQSTISRIERGHGGSLSLDLWQRVFLALDRRLVVESPRDPRQEPKDAGHLRIQELVLRLGRAAGYLASFELPSRPIDPHRSTDVGLRDDVHGRLILVECWNTIGDIGAAARSTTRKLAETQDLAVAVGHGRTVTVTGCWVVRATARNRELIVRYPEVFGTRFPGSSLRWVVR
jgi:transcriptional regulator with XRE-family HTH domain